MVKGTGSHSIRVLAQGRGQGMLLLLAKQIGQSIEHGCALWLGSPIVKNEETERAGEAEAKY